VDPDAVFSAVDVKNIYEVPRAFYDEGLDQKIAIMLKLPAKNPDLTKWRELLYAMDNLKHRVRIGIVGKYVDLKESYKSLHEALVHGGVANDAEVELVHINAEDLTVDNLQDHFRDVEGILIPGGFGTRGIEGKILASGYARENKVPFFGICLGMQCAVIEFARSILGLEGANSSEFDEDTPHPVIYLMTEWYDMRNQCLQTRNSNSDKGGTMRLGAYPCRLKPGTRAQAAYGNTDISERHRHRYEFNNAYAGKFEEAGMLLSGVSPDNSLVEIVELEDHPWFVACQFHPEFQSNPMRAHPLFREFIRSVCEAS
jgi:CTP synthase